MNGNNLVVRAVERWANEVVHGCVDNQEALAVVFLPINHTRQEHARGADDGATGLEEEVDVELAQGREDGIGVGGNLGREGNVRGRCAFVIGRPAQ